MPKENIAAIKSKLAALLARARDAGSSEAEVAACLSRAEKLMATYSISEADAAESVANELTYCEYEKAKGMKKHSPLMRYCAGPLARFCGVVGYVSDDLIKVAGLPVDVEYFKWLVVAQQAFMDDQWSNYRDFSLGRVTPQRLKAERIGFVQGFCEALSRRIVDMTMTKGDGMAKGTAVVMVKRDLILAKLASQGVNLGGAVNLGGKQRGDSDAKAAGYSAGQDAIIGQGVGKAAIAIGAR